MVTRGLIRFGVLGVFHEKAGCCQAHFSFLEQIPLFGADQREARACRHLDIGPLSLI
jgi:hypothetical protein